MCFSLLMDARCKPKLVQTPWGHKPVALQEDMNLLTRHPQHQRDLGKEQEVLQLEKVRHIIGNGTWTGRERGWEADDVGNPCGCGLHKRLLLLTGSSLTLGLQVRWDEMGILSRWTGTSGPH